MWPKKWNEVANMRPKARGYTDTALGIDVQHYRRLRVSFELL